MKRLFAAKGRPLLAMTQPRPPRWTAGRTDRADVDEDIRADTEGRSACLDPAAQGAAGCAPEATPAAKHAAATAPAGGRCQPSRSCEEAAAKGRPQARGPQAGALRRPRRAHRRRFSSLSSSQKQRSGLSFPLMGSSPRCSTATSDAWSNSARRAAEERFTRPGSDVLSMRLHMFIVSPIRVYFLRRGARQGLARRLLAAVGARQRAGGRMPAHGADQRAGDGAGVDARPDDEAAPLRGVQVDQRRARRSDGAQRKLGHAQRVVRLRLRDAARHDELRHRAQGGGGLRGAPLVQSGIRTDPLRTPWRPLTGGLPGPAGACRVADGLHLEEAVLHHQRVQPRKEALQHVRHLLRLHGAGERREADDVTEQNGGHRELVADHRLARA